MMLIAQTDWPESLVALGGIFLVAAIAVALIWQIFKTGRAGIASKTAKALQHDAEETAEFQKEMRAGISRANESLQDVRDRVAEIERLLKDVE